MWGQHCYIIVLREALPNSSDGFGLLGDRFKPDHWVQQLIWQMCTHCLQYLQESQNCTLSICTLHCKFRSIMQTICEKSKKKHQKNARRPVCLVLALSFWKTQGSNFATCWIISCEENSYLRLKTNLSLCVFLHCANLNSARHVKMYKYLSSTVKKTCL